MRGHAKASSAGSTTDAGFGRVVASRLSLVVLLATAGLLALAAAPALALETHVLSTSFGAAASTPSNPYPLSTPTGIAIDQASHSIYVTDPGNEWVEKFDPAGNLILIFGKGVDQTSGEDVCTISSGDTCQPGSSGSSPGQFTTPAFVAVDNSNSPSKGDVYVGDTGTNLVQKFKADGTLIESWGSGGQLDGSASPNGPFAPLGGIAVDSTGRLDVLESDPEKPEGQRNRVFQFGEDGAFGTDFPLTIGAVSLQSGLAVDAVGNFFWVEINAQVWKGDSKGQANVGVTHLTVASAFALDPSANGLYVDNGPAGSLGIQYFAFDNAGNVIEPDSSTCPITGNTGCEPTEVFAQNQIGGSLGITVDPANRNVYATDPNHQRVEVFPFVILADVSVEAAESTEPSTATLHGHLDPTGGPETTQCKFEWGPSTSYGNTTPCAEGNAFAEPATVSAELTGLQASTTYHFRLAVANKNGTNSSSDHTFTTPDPPEPPSVLSESVPAIGKHSATLQAQVNPHGVDTTYHFEYIAEGADYQANGFENATKAPQPDADAGSAFLPQSLSQGIAGLGLQTTYHYRVVAENAEGPPVAGPDQTFTTLPASRIESEFATGVAQSTVTLQAQVNPLGNDTTYHFEYIAEGPDYQEHGFEHATKAPQLEEADLGSAKTGQLASQELSGLALETTYHFRVVAVNVDGTVIGQDLTFRTAGSMPTAGLPDGRVYERVSPSEKSGYDVYNNLQTGDQASHDGTTIIYQALGAFSGSVSNTTINYYTGSRGSGPWTTTPLNLATPTSPPTFGYEGIEYVSPDNPAEQVVIATQPYTPDTPPNVISLFLHKSDGSYQLITPAPPPSQAGNYQASFIGASSDLSHIVFQANADLTPNAPPGPTTAA